MAIFTHFYQHLIFIFTLFLAIVTIYFGYRFQANRLSIHKYKLREKALALDVLSHVTELMKEKVGINFEQLCDALVKDELTTNQQAWLTNWTLSDDHDQKTELALKKNRCLELTKTYAFTTTPLSEKERLFPLAYGLLVYNNLNQVLYLLSAIYHPQNLYCIAIDHKTQSSFMNALLDIQHCLPNVKVVIAVDIEWGEYGILYSVMQCLKVLTESRHQWKYYQYLSGVDLPLKTNSEMIDIFKQLNNSINVEITSFQPDRLQNPDKDIPPYNVTLFKGSLSATFNRQTAQSMLNNHRVNKLLDFLKTTAIPDETFWATLAGNYDKIQIANSFNGSKFLEITKKLENKNRVRQQTYYISRYQIWSDQIIERCNGKWVHSSCVYGINDVPHLLAVPHLVAHKFYPDYQPAAYFCTYYQVRKRALLGLSTINLTFYADLPGPRMTRGQSVNEWFAHS